MTNVPWEQLALLHDILKLAGDSKMHYQPNKDARLQKIEAANPELWLALNHHFRALQFPLQRELFWVSMADCKAAAISRRLRRLHGSRPLFRVWRDNPASHSEYQAQPKEIVTDLIDRLLVKRDPGELYEELLPFLKARAEATQWKGDGCPFASLNTHSELTRRWFRFLNAESGYFDVPEIIETRSKMWGVLKGILNRKSLLLIRIRIRTAGRLSRLRDAVVVAEIPEVRQRINDAFGSHSIYDLHDETLIAARPEFREEIEQRLQKTIGKRTNYFLETTVIETPMRHGGRGRADSPASFLHNFPFLFSDRSITIYPHLQPEILPDETNEASREGILCDLCQLAEARVVYPKNVYQEDDSVQEFLCDECKELRMRAKRLTQLVAWEDEAEEKGGSEGHKDIRVALIKLSVDLRQWWEATTKLFQQGFPDELGKHDLNDEDLGFSILEEFLTDYRQFLEQFRGTVLSIPNKKYALTENHNEIIPGLLALKIHDDNEVVDIVARYAKLFSDFFPKWTHDVTPIRLSVSCSNLKFPFLVHWDFLNNPRQPINIQAVNRARLEINFAQWDALQAMNLKQVGSFLHRLATIHARTGSMRLVEIELLERRAEFSKVTDPYRTNLLKAQQILDYYKLARENLTHG